jgi:rhodanese-related sulfurtransferase
MVSATDQGHYQVQGAATINAEQAKALLAQGVAVFEMRHSRHWRAGHPAWASFAQRDIGEFTAANLEKLFKKDQAVAFYCGGFTCRMSALASAKAVIWGYKNVYDFAGGIPEWVKAGYPLVTDD